MKLLPLFFLLLLAAYWLPRLVVWILQPDYNVRAFEAAEERITRYCWELTHSPAGKGNNE